MCKHKLLKLFKHLMYFMLVDGRPAEEFMYLSAGAKILGGVGT